MSINNFKETLTQLLKQDTRMLDEQGELLINIIHELTNALDPQLIELLLSDVQTREKFFLRINDVYVFKQSDFKFFLDENKIDNSYTQYENKIGLSFGSRLLRETTDVVLNFPYKDCVLEGGQSTEEGTDIYFEYDVQAGDYAEKKAKRKEVFFNQVLARDEIDRLFEPKAFISPEAGVFTRNENGTITDNLIIKGNNLLALHSLKQEFRGKVKLIYIDPPYNTGNDSFAYNDNFNHSTWLTFMKNRLEVSRELLREDGVIFVQCDDNEQAYLKVLMDDLFKRENFISNLVWKGRGGRQDSKHIAQIHETIIVFAKDKIITEFNKKIVTDDSNYSIFDEKAKKNYKTQLIRKWGSNSRKLDRPNLFYGVRFEGREIYPILPNGEEGCWRWAKPKLEKAILDDLVVMVEKEGKVELYEKIFEGDGKKEVVFNSWIDDSFSGKGIGQIENLFGDKVFAYPKPEDLIKYILEIASNENDIVLDYHAGSGTTAAVALKMKRQFITIEQMDYIENVTVERLKKVIEGEQGGISKAVNWQGGGSFIYLELAKNNQNAIENIQKANNLAELMTFFEEMYEKYFLSYNVRIKEFKEKISQEGAFKNLPLERQKQIFAKMLDLNQLYINASDMEDTRFGLSQSDIALTKDFYQLV